MEHLNTTTEYANKEELKKDFPNIERVGTSDNNKVPEKEMIKKCENLLTLAELYDIEHLVFEIDVHGTVPVMFIDRDPENENPNSGRVTKKIYENPNTGNMWAEGWDPQEVGIEITGQTGTVTYYIKA